MKEQACRSRTRADGSMPTMTGGKHGAPITPVGICSAMAPAIAPAMAADGNGKEPMTPHIAPTSEMWLVRSVILCGGKPHLR